MGRNSMQPVPLMASPSHCAVKCEWIQKRREGGREGGRRRRGEESSQLPHSLLAVLTMLVMKWKCGSLVPRPPLFLFFGLRLI